jgi:hypothetical protein
MRKINITIEIQDNDLIEFKLNETLCVLLGNSMIDYQVLTNTKELYDNDEHFRKLCKLHKAAQREKNDYINSKL